MSSSSSTVQIWSRDRFCGCTTFTLQTTGTTDHRLLAKHLYSDMLCMNAMLCYTLAHIDETVQLACLPRVTADKQGSMEAERHTILQVGCVLTRYDASSSKVSKGLPAVASGNCKAALGDMSQKLVSPASRI